MVYNFKCIIFVYQNETKMLLVKVYENLTFKESEHNIKTAKMLASRHFNNVLNFMRPYNTFTYGTNTGLELPFYRLNNITPDGKIKFGKWK